MSPRRITCENSTSKCSHTFLVVGALYISVACAIFQSGPAVRSKVDHTGRAFKVARGHRFLARHDTQIKRLGRPSAHHGTRFIAQAKP